MNRLLHVSLYEFWKIVGKRGFWLSTVAFPVLMTVFVVSALLVIILLNRDDVPDVVGFVDYSGVLAGVEETVVDGIGIRPYPNEEAAQQAVLAEEIQGFYVLPADYLETHQLSLTVQDNLPITTAESFAEFLRTRLVYGAETSVRNRLVAGADILVHTVDRPEAPGKISRETIIRAVMMFSALFGMVFILGDIAGYSSMIVSDERDNRTLEMMITTLTPSQFVLGKIIGLIGVTLTRPFVWFLMALPFLLGLFALAATPVYELIDWSFLWMLLLFILPAVAFFFGLMTVASLAINDPKYSGQMSSLLSSALIFSAFIGVSLLFKEENSVALFFSFFPLTSFMVIVMRQAITDVPTWQIILSWLILLASTAASLWLAIYLFKSGRVFTGRPFQWRSMWRRALRRVS